VNKVKKVTGRRGLGGRKGLTNLNKVTKVTGGGSVTVWMLVLGCSRHGVGRDDERIEPYRFE
jgi:hypothetical protein